MHFPEIATLAKMFQGNAFQPFIDYIRFPYFRNLEPNARIDFTFPLTVFVGQNGCGKSSALQAIYGCPYGKSVGDYWFNTLIDPIVEMRGGARNCLIYSYDGGGAAREVLKTRIAKKNKPDLWDTSPPLARYGMDPTATRVEPVQKTVVYLNFRAGHSAFEKAFYEEIPPASRVQDFLRDRSWYLHRIRQGRVPLPRFRGKTHEGSVGLNDVELKEVSEILGKTYKSATLIKHRVFNNWGYSVFFETRHAQYSEAVAGSGETTVALLVHEVLAAPPSSLVLLDEPETSLHPGAQLRLVKFLLRQCVAKRHQVVICSHAQAVVESLPASALKVFCPTPTGQFRVFGSVLPSEAFHFLGHPIENKRLIIVEDRLAKEMFDSVLGEDAAEASMLEVRHFPGGASVMKQDATVYMRDPKPPKFLVFDGDENPKIEVFDPKNLTAEQLGDPVKLTTFLGQRIKEAIGMEIEFRVDGGAAGGDKTQEAALQQDYLNYFRMRARFLPFATPEDELWDDAIARNLVHLVVGEEEGNAFLAEIAALTCKDKFARLTAILVGRSTGTAISGMHDMFIQAWRRKPGAQAGSIAAIKALIDEIKAAPDQ